MWTSLVEDFRVTPYVGVWIETQLLVMGRKRTGEVTPYVGVWIETSLKTS